MVADARFVLALMTAITGLWLMALSFVHVNASFSDDAWGYVVLPLIRDPKMGEKVLFQPPDAVGSPVPYVKTVRGIAGAAISVGADGLVRIDGIAAGRAKARAIDGRQLAPAEPGTIPDGQYYLHADHPDSHDSRYAEIGLVPGERILGRAFALPDLPWLGLKGPLTGPEDVRMMAPAEARR